MNNVTLIHKKLSAFIRKYYSNILIKGSIVFVVLGLSYFLFTLFLEYVFWLSPFYRTLLFWLFVVVEISLLVFYIILPILKLLGLKKGINTSQASKIIGAHFKEVDDKLLNLIQLEENLQQSDLLLASIEQKANKLQNISFVKAVDFKKNLYLSKYLLLPFLIIIVVLVSGKSNPFKESLGRIVHYQKVYTPPSPFTFTILNRELKVIEGQDLRINISTKGSLTPNQAEIIVGNQHYFLKQDALGFFSFLFENVTEDFAFTLHSNNVKSRPYKVKVLRKPIISLFKMHLDYPKYTRRKDIDVNNTGNATVPEGTIVKWQLQTKQTNKISFIINKKRTLFKSNDVDNYSHSERLLKTLNYKISTSNNDLKNFEKLSYTVLVVKDEFPKISVTSDIDSVNYGEAQFGGQISDDYGLKKLELVYYKTGIPKEKQYKAIDIKSTIFDTFYYALNPNNNALNLIQGQEYSFYFEVYDNDAVNGSKSAKSPVFKYYNKTDLELTKASLNAQKKSINALQRDKNFIKEIEKNLKSVTDKLKNQANFKWNDAKQIKELLKRRQKEQNLINNHLNDLQKNLNKNNLKKGDLKDQKENLNKRLEEAKELLKKEKTLEELKKLAKKLDKDGLLKKLEKFNQQSKQNKRTLERILELTKRFYIDKKLTNISKDIVNLSSKQDSLAKSKDNNPIKQEAINKQFKNIRKAIEEVKKDNKTLNKPMAIPKTNREEFQINEDLKKTAQNLKNKHQKEAISNQKSAAKKMAQMGKKMQQSMMGGGAQRHEENIETLQVILDNLLIYSLDQETLMNEFKQIDDKHPDFSKRLRQQQVLKDYFEHVDDSLYTLSLRMPRLSAKIQDEILDTHYNIDMALKNLAENKISRGNSNQQYAMTASNNLALLLSNMLDRLQNPNPSMGKGKKGKNAQSFSLPDIIKKQSKIIQDLKKGIKKGKSGKGKNEEMSEQQYEIYKQQEALKQALDDLLKSAGKSGEKGSKAQKLMDDLEKQLLDKGFSNTVLQKMTELQHELLKLEKAKLKKGTDTKREATTNTKQFSDRLIKALKFTKDSTQKNEMLNRKPLLLKLPYQKKVQHYFKDSI
ncbi:MAG: hypothetical protein QM486_02515 [Flavobacteriaceae bacterium]